MNFLKAKNSTEEVDATESIPTAGTSITLEQTSQAINSIETLEQASSKMRFSLEHAFENQL